jgi:hypothetical protein
MGKPVGPEEHILPESSRIFRAQHKDSHENKALRCPAPCQPPQRPQIHRPQEPRGCGIAKRKALSHGILSIHRLGSVLEIMNLKHIFCQTNPFSNRRKSLALRRFARFRPFSKCAFLTHFEDENAAPALYVSAVQMSVPAFVPCNSTPVPEQGKSGARQARKRSQIRPQARQQVASSAATGGLKCSKGWPQAQLAKRAFILCH